MPDPDPEQLRFRAGDLDVGALAWGADGDPLVLCLHGYPDTAWTWRRVAPRLAARGLRVVAPFSRGYGPTALAPDGDYSLSALAADAVAVRDALGGDERAFLVGHDWGALTVLRLAARRPGAFARPVTLAIPAGRPLLRAAATTLAGALPRQLAMSWYIAFQQLPGLSEAQLPRLIPRLWRDWSPGYDATEDVAHVLASLDGRARQTAALRYYRATFRDVRVGGWFDPLRQPLLALHGDRDGCVHPRLSRAAGAGLPAGSVAEEIAGAGHFLQLERPAEVAARIAGWLEA